jgi:hypothetical protein
MEIYFLKSFLDGLNWFNKYYVENFPEGKAKATTHFEQTLLVLKNFPEASPILNKSKFIRKIKITRTPFSLYYNVNLKKQRIEVLYLRDERKKLTEEFLENLKQII